MHLASDLFSRTPFQVLQLPLTIISFKALFRLCSQCANLAGELGPQLLTRQEDPSELLQVVIINLHRLISVLFIEHSRVEHSVNHGDQLLKQALLLLVWHLNPQK